ncbi:uncharacterized protein LOC141914264 [Tubulanus polymorphus]|uniref:uncharacterized protein LOC141914264 n=1 Tax=Tubulanus polymorphus TaxID=672921 RepID=UPI003DA689FD
MDTDVAKSTRKLRSHTILETQKQSFQKIDDDNRDSGTESDEENAELEEIEKQMEKDLQRSKNMTRSQCNKKNSSSHLVSEGDSPHFSQHTDLSDSDQDLDKDTSDFERQNSDLERHSSEEELSVINGKELQKRTWSQMNRHASRSAGHSASISSSNSHLGGRSSGSTSDDEVKELLFKPQPLIFSSSPPKGILRIRKAPPERYFLTRVTSMAPIEVCAISPRKRHRFNSSSDRKKKTVIQRPSLDFEKMQKALREEAAHCWRIEEMICKRLKIED